VVVDASCPVSIAIPVIVFVVAAGAVGSCTLAVAWAIAPSGLLFGCVMIGALIGVANGMSRAGIVTVDGSTDASSVCDFVRSPVKEFRSEEPSPDFAWPLGVIGAAVVVWPVISPKNISNNPPCCGWPAAGVDCPA